MPSYSPVSCQLFIYNTYGINSENMSPLIYFANRATELNFVRALISRPVRRLPDEPYFVINNPHFLPDDVRQMHDSIEHDDDTGEEVIRRRDNCYSIRDNLDLLLSCVFDNNTTLDTGFQEALRTFIR